MNATPGREKARTGRLSKSGPIQQVIFTIILAIIVFGVLGILGYVALGLFALHSL